MSIMVVQFQGRFGNQGMQWAFAQSYARRHGLELQHGPWIGESIFENIPATRPHDPGKMPRYNEAQLEAMVSPPDHPFVFRGYAQTQWCVSHYTKRDAQKWLTFRDNIAQACRLAISDDIGKGRPDTVVCHRREGDFAGYGYPVVSLGSYKTACEQFGLDWDNVTVLSEDDPTPISTLPSDLSFVADFYRMVKAPTLLRANSTFSWVAGLLSDGLVLSPVIDGLAGGRVQDCPFKAGNHPRLASFDFTTELYVNP